MIAGMKTIARWLLALGLTFSAAMAQDGPLPPGKPAGVKQASINETPYLVGAAVVATVAGLLLFKTSNASSASSTTS
jgi:hypothetical protein